MKPKFNPDLFDGYVFESGTFKPNDNQIKQAVKNGAKIITEKIPWWKFWKKEPVIECYYERVGDVVTCHYPGITFTERIDTSKMSPWAKWLDNKKSEK